MREHKYRAWDTHKKIMYSAEELGPKPIIEEGKVINHEQLKRYWAGVAERKARIQRGTFRDLRDAREQSSTPGTVPQPEPEWTRGQWDYIRQLRAMVNHLNIKVTEMRAEKKKDVSDKRYSIS